MTSDTVALVWGSGLVAFAPLLCLFFQIAYPKSQLIIVTTTSAFFFLLSSLAASICWYILAVIIGLSGFGASLVPGIICQFMGRCSFVALYHKMEHIIEESIERTELRDYERRQRQQQTNNTTTTTNNNPTSAQMMDAAKLRLELNDASCGLAAGIGFGGMHAILLYGTLLASESSDFGALYQPSCPYIPTLIVSAIHCFFFFVLDLFFMCFTFFGMRRRLIFPRGGGTLTDMTPSRAFGHYFGNTRTGGNLALWWTFLGHIAASGVTTFNGFQYGCMFSLSLLPVVTIIIAYGFWSGVSKIYMPLPHSTERLSLPASFSYGSRAEGALNGDDDEDEDDDDDEPNTNGRGGGGWDNRPSGGEINHQVVDNDDWDSPPRR